MIMDPAMLPGAQREAIEKLIADLHGDEVRDSYPIRRAGIPWTPGTIWFKDGEERYWFVRPDGSFTWKT